MRTEIMSCDVCLTTIPPRTYFADDGEAEHWRIDSRPVGEAPGVEVDLVLSRLRDQVCRDPGQRGRVTLRKACASVIALACTYTHLASFNLLRTHPHTLQTGP